MSWRERATPVEIKPNAAVSAAGDWRSRAVAVSQPTPAQKPVEVKTSPDYVQPQFVFSSQQEQSDYMSAVNAGTDDAMQSYQKKYGRGSYSPGISEVAGASVLQGIAGIGDAVLNTPETISRFAGATINAIDKSDASTPIGALNKYVLGPVEKPILGTVKYAADTLATGRMGGNEDGTQIFTGASDIAKQAQQQRKAFESQSLSFRNVAEINQQADAAFKGVFEGQLKPVGQVLADPKAWASFIGNAAPSLVAGYMSGGSLPFTAWLEGMESSSNAQDFEQKTGQKMSDEQFSASVAQVSAINGILEKYGIDKILKTKGLKDVLVSAVSEGTTEGLQSLNTNIAQYWYSPKVNVTQGVLQSVIGGFGSGGIASGAKYGLEKVSGAAEESQSGNIRFSTDPVTLPLVNTTLPPPPGGSGTPRRNPTSEGLALSENDPSHPGYIHPRVDQSVNRDVLAQALSGDEQAVAQLQNAQPVQSQQGVQVGDVIEQTIPNGPTIRGTVQQITRAGETTVYALQESPESEPTFVYDADGEIQVVGKGQQVLAPEAPTTRGQLEQQLQPQPAATITRPVQAQAEPSLKDRLLAMPETELVDLYQGKNVQQRNMAKAELDRRFPGWNMPKQIDVATAAADVNQAPTDAQKEAGNYKKGHVSLNGLDISIENPVGSVRSGTDTDGKRWQVTMPANYGYIKRTEGADGDHVDVYVGDVLNSDNVYAIDQIDPKTGKFDETKFMIGFANQEHAIRTYLDGFSDGRGMSRFGAVKAFKFDGFKEWLKRGDTKRPVSYRVPIANVEQAPARTEPKPIQNIQQAKTVDDDSTGLKAMGGGIAGAISGNLRTALYQKFAMGSVTENGQPSAFLQVAKAIKDTGVNVNRPVFDRIILDVQSVRDSGVTGAEYQKGLRDVVAKYAPAPVKDSLTPVQQPTLERKYLGKNKEGLDLFEDKRGVRMKHAEEGSKFLITEGVIVVPSGGIKIERKDDFLTMDEFKAKAEKQISQAVQERVDAASATSNNPIENTAKESKDAGNGTSETPARVQPVAEPSPAALEGVPAGDVRRTGEGEAAGGGTVQGVRTDVAGNEQPDAAGGNMARGVGSKPGTVPAAAPGAGDGRGTDAGERGVQRIAGDGGRDAGTAGDEARQAGVIAPAPENYVIRPADRLGQGGQSEKYRDNIAAIKLLRKLQNENRRATPDEQAILVRYVGWGGIKAAFPNSLGQFNKGWETKGAELRGLLTDQEYNDARESVLNAHFTAENVVKGMWSAVSRLGFKHGTVLEPALGTGNFFGLMPAESRAKSSMTGVELDTLTGNIAKQLYPSFNIHAPVGFQEAPLADGHFDLVIGNPPFGAEKVPGAREKDIGDFSVHNYFFARSINKLRPGGILAMVVTNRFLDKPGEKQRQWIADRAEFVGAIRLPNTAFQENALTEVTTDIIFMRKLEDGAKSADTSWTQVGQIPDPLGGDTIPVNQYFINNPDMLLGRMERSGTMRQANDPTLADDGRDLTTAFAEAISKLPQGIFKPSTTVLSADDMRRAAAKPVDAASEYAVGSYFAESGKIMQRQESPDGSPMAVEITPDTQWTEKQTIGEKRFEKLKGMVEIRDAARAVLRMEASDTPDAEVERARRRLNVVYDQFQKEHGYLNDTTNERMFASDPDAPLLLALESDYDGGISSAKAKTLGIKSRKATGTKAAIFRQRVIPKWEPVTKADNPKDALGITLSEKGIVDIEHMAKLTGMTEEQLGNALSYESEKPVIFKNPETNEWETASVYLSGNVKHKEAVARKMGAVFQADALKDVFPPDVAAGDIKIRMGASWVNTKYYEQFMAHLFGEDTVARVVYMPSSGGFYVDVSGGLRTNLTQKWGTPRISGADIVDKLLNSREIIIRDRQPDGSSVVNKEETLAASTKADEIKEEFGEWIMKDAERRMDLASYYNDKMNTDVEPEFDGSHLQMPGMNPTKRLRRHQKNAIWRNIQQRTSLLDHVVGSGKTFTIAGSAMELRRTGLAKKPMVVVPNHLVQQWAKEFYALYPGARLLTMGKKDFEKKNRRKMLARIATGDWDAVIVAHSSFGFIPVSKEVETRFIDKQIIEVQESIDAVRQVEGKGGRRVSDMERSKKNLEAKLKKLADKPKDDMLTWEELGVDQMFVDESHEFKNLYFTTGRRGVLGLGNPKGSQKSFDMFIKTQWMLNKQGGKGVVFATGTPISNSLSEMYTLQRYLGMSELESRKILSFDAWMNNFGDDYVDYELDGTAQKYKQVTRLRGLTNLPELMKLYKQFADSVTNNQVKAAYREDNPGKEFPIPRVVGGKNRENVVVPRSDEQAAYFEEIVERASNLKAGGTDNMLNITTDARKAALDMRLVNPDMQDNPDSKTNVAADRIAEIWRKWQADKGTQLVFLDLSIPLSAAKNEGAKLRELLGEIQQTEMDVERIEEFGGNTDKLDGLRKKLDDLQETLAKNYTQDDILAVKSAERGFSVYDDMRQKLIDRGVRAEEIAFIHDFNTDLKKAELFDMVNAGQIRVLFGSTTKMGAGTNVQERLVALHHIDCPWRPSDIEQREGRIIRQGNDLLEKYGMDKFEVQVLAYATEKTYDARMWQTQEQKLLGIEGLRNYNGSREMEEVAAASASAAEMKAAATGNPLILEDVQLSESLRKLEIALKAHQRKEFDMQDNMRSYNIIIERGPKSAADYRADAKRYAPYAADPFDGNPPKGTVAGKEYTSAEAAFKAAEEEVSKQGDKYSVDINGVGYTSKLAIEDAILAGWGDANPFQIEIYGQKYRSRRDAAKAIVNKVGEDIKGRFAGFDFTVSVDVAAVSGGPLLDTKAVFSVEIDGTGKKYHVESRQGDSEKGEAAARRLFKSMQDVLSGLERDAIQTESSVERAKKEIVSIKDEVGKPFPKEDELRQKRERLNQVRKELAGTSQQGEPTMPVTDTGKPMMSISSEKTVDSDTLKGIETAIAKRLKEVGWSDMEVVIAPQVKVQDVKKTLAGAYWNNIIYLAMEQDPVATLNHELIHALREVKAFTDSEWKQLSSKGSEWRTKYGVDQKYGNLGLSDSELVEEAVAAAFQDYSMQGTVRRLANRILRFLAAIKDSLTTGEWNFTRPEDVFDAILSGKVAPRRKTMSAKDRRIMFATGEGKDKEQVLDDASQAVEDLLASRVRGMNRKLPDDMGAVASFIIHPHQVASFHQEFTPVYTEAVKQFEMRDEIVHDLTNYVESYNRLSAASKEKVNAVLELGRLDGKTFYPDADKTITVKNSGQPDAVFTKAGQSVKLDEWEATVYLRVRRAMGKALDTYIEVLIEEYGMGERGITNRRKLEKAILEESNEGVREKMVGLLKMVKEIEEAKRRGYIPFKRWGNVGIVVKERSQNPQEPGEVVWYSQIDVNDPAGRFSRAVKRLKGEDYKELGSQPQVREAIEQLSSKYDDKEYEIITFPVSSFADLEGKVNLKDLDVLAASSDLSQDEYGRLRAAIEDSLKRRGFKAHFYQSRNVAGYSPDFERAINDYVVGIAGHLSRRRHAPRIERAINGMIQKKVGKNLIKYAQNYQRYIQNPQEEFQMLRQVGFFYYIAGNMASALTNLMQVPMVTAPWMKGMASHKQVAGLLGTAYKDTAKMFAFPRTGLDVFDPKKAPADIRDVMEQAWREGYFVPLNTYEAMAISNTNIAALRGLSRNAREAMNWVAIKFSTAERVNRMATFIAAYRMAMNMSNYKKIVEYIRRDALAREMVLSKLPDRGGKNEDGTVNEKAIKEFARQFAEYATISTQLRMGRLNRPAIFRGAGTLVFQFMSFTAQVLELQYRLVRLHGAKGAQAVGFMLLALVAMSGIWGLPFADDLKELFEFIYKRMTRRDIDIETEVRGWIAKRFGTAIAEAISRGVPRVVANVDMSVRLGFGDIIPNDTNDLLGVWYDMMIGRPGRVATEVSRDQYAKAFAEAMPNWIGNMIKAVEMAGEGVQSMATGDTIIPPEAVTNWDATLKFFGFTSANVSNERERNWAVKRASNAINDLRADYYDRLAVGITRKIRSSNRGDTEAVERYTEEVQSIFDEVNRYNANVPGYKQVIIRPQTLRQRVKEELQGAEANKPRKQARSRAEEINQIFGAERP